MLLKRIQLVAQVIGFVCIGLLAVYGGVAAVTGGGLVRAADVAAPQAITPSFISYQGTLRDASDNPANGTYDMVVRIYPVASGGSVLWSETHNSVTVREGHFSLLLGQSTAIPTALFTDPDLYVELTVGGNVMTPRQRFAAVPYAMAATYATKLSAPDGTPAEAVTVENDGTVVVTEGDIEIPQGGMCIDSDGACSAPGAGGLRVGSIEGTDSSSDNVILVPNSGKVGIGTGSTALQAMLDVNGYALVSGKLGVGTTKPSKKLTVIGALRGANDASEGDYVEMGHGGGNGYLNTFGAGNLDFRHDGNTKMSLTDSGDLTVNGTVAADALTIDGHKPIFFRKYRFRDHSYVHYTTTYSENAWACGIVSIRANGNLNENYGGDANLLRAQTYTSDGVWHIYVDFPNEDGREDWDITLMCIDSDLVEWKPDYEW